MQRHRYALAEQWVSSGLEAPDADAMELLRHILDEGTLGASNQIRKIAALLKHLAGAGEPSETLRRQLYLTGRFITQCRGGEAPVIGHFVSWMLDGTDGKSGAEIERILRRRASDWDERAQQRLELLLRCAAEVLGDAERLVLFDYSSTVAAIVKDAVARRSDEPEIVVCESRALAGGAPYVRELIEDGIAFTMIPDVAIEHVVDGATALLMGVESLRPDGSLVNTIGSRPIARAARAAEGAVYGCCDSSKLDAGPTDEHQRPPKTRCMYEPLVAGVDGTLKSMLDGHRGLVTSRIPEVEVVPPELLTGYITDSGLIPPSEIGAWQERREAFV